MAHNEMNATILLTQDKGFKKKQWFFKILCVVQYLAHNIQ